MKVSLFYLPSIGSRSEIEAGCAGLRGDLYSRMLAELAEQAVLADELGYDSISFTEHHFHVEGVELSNNPVLLDLFIGMKTQRIRVGQLGIVLPAQNPILPPLHPRLERSLFELYAEVSGRPLGEGVGVLRDVVVAETDEEAMRLWRDSGAFCGAAWFEPFGFSKGLADPDGGETPDLFAEGLALVGSVDTVTRQLETLRERLPAQWVFAWAYNGLIPHAALMRSIELFHAEVLSRVTDRGPA